MSLYNMVMKTDPAAQVLVPLLFDNPDDLPPRIRDCCLIEKEGQLRIHLLTRQGGGNRADYQESNAALEAHPLYIEDYDDPFDSTYACFEFRLPDGILEDEYLMTQLREKALRDKTPMERFKEFIDNMGVQK